MLSTSTATTEDKANGILAVCGLCRRQFAKYTCPSCNVPYCSLTCFRSDSHGECSEGFYRKEVETDIQSEPSKTAEERRRMMELLKKFEEDSLKQEDGDGDDGDDSDGEDGTNELSKRLRGTGDYFLDSTLPDDLWTLLTPSQQQKFLKALQDPSSELAQQLLASDHIEKDTVLPWWNNQNHGYLELDGEHETELRDSLRYGKDPRPMQIPTRMVTPVEGGPSLVYNIVAVLIAYAYTTRSFAVSPLSSIPPHSPDVLEAQRTIARVTPFLVERRATAVFGSVAEVVTDIWARLGQGNDNNEAVSVFLGDAAELLRPLPVVPLPPLPLLSSPQDPDPDPSYEYDAHPHRRTALALSDLYHLYSFPSSTLRGPRKVNPTKQKLVFYGARMLVLPSHMLSVVAQELLAYIELMKRERSVQVSESASGTTSTETRVRVGSSKPLVEEV
ncbi:hypothetical protein BDN71DRAFT_1502444 [Pleurotus eryngii]|uniref:HIT-type domain-containing protein n=1 Tax=Pleurotus eryngii TaxID=5323 RepID=A0A9P6A840_PLEER|nr:hypothetical protein BDN71DRAFT_1502444 [Pleurotus eryngii]